MVCVVHAEPAPSILRCGVLPLHHYELLPAVAVAGPCAESRSVSAGAGAGAAKVPLCGCGIRGDARACALADQRAAARRSVGGDESPETRLRPPSAFSYAPGAGLETDAALAGADGAGPHLAASVLRFRCLFGTQARGEAALHAPGSSKAGTRPGAATVDME